MEVFYKATNKITGKSYEILSAKRGPIPYKMSLGNGPQIVPNFSSALMATFHKIKKVFLRNKLRVTQGF
jgi:hypothetical protein